MLTPEQVKLQEQAKLKLANLSQKPISLGGPVMAFGKYKGQLLEDVSASYLLWVWENAECLDYFPEVKDYIEKNLNGIKKQITDGRGNI